MTRTQIGNYEETQNHINFSSGKTVDMIEMFQTCSYCSGFGFLRYEIIHDTNNGHCSETKRVATLKMKENHSYKWNEETSVIGALEEMWSLTNDSTWYDAQENAGKSSGFGSGVDSRFEALTSKCRSTSIGDYAIVHITNDDGTKTEEVWECANEGWNIIPSVPDFENMKWNHFAKGGDFRWTLHSYEEYQRRVENGDMEKYGIPNASRIRGERVN